jgi:hypothetical protein
VEPSLGIAARRREALWQLGLASTGHASGADTQLALPLELPAAPRLRPLSRWQRLIADYATSGVTVGDHVMAALRPRLRKSELTTSAQLARLSTGSSVTVAGLVIARQRPGTAKGTMFLLFEDEWGTLNLIVPRAVYERHRHLARAEPLLLARGRLERAGENQVVQMTPDRPVERDPPAGAQDGEGSSGEQEHIPPIVNVIVRELVALERLGGRGRPGRPACISCPMPSARRRAGTRRRKRRAPRSARACVPWPRRCRTSRRDVGGSWVLARCVPAGCVPRDD